MDGNTVRRVTPTKEEFVFRFVSSAQQHTSLDMSQTDQRTPISRIVYWNTNIHLYVSDFS